MKPFYFQKFSVKQTHDVFRVGTDGVLLGAICPVLNADKILEAGAGSGLISLMVAQRNPNAQILAIDINENAVKLAEENFSNSSFSGRLKIKLQDYKTFNTKEKFDLIISNPPYFEANDSRKDTVARQQKELNFTELIKKSAELLSQSGTLSVIIPFESVDVFSKICLESNLFLHRKITVFGIKTSKPKRAVLDFGFTKLPTEEKEFTIESFPRKYSAEYIALTKDFHVFKE